MEKYITKIADFCEKNLDFDNAISPDEYGYECLPYCVIHSVFSINATAQAARNVVVKLVEYLKEETYMDPDALTINKLINIYRDIGGSTKMAEKVYDNRQRTSTTGGILKSRGVFLFCKVLQKYKVNSIDYLDKVLDNSDFEEEIKKIPGQKSGKSLNFFYMLAGEEGKIKIERHIERFIESIINKRLNDQKNEECIIGVWRILKKKHPNLTLRILDNLIWNYQKDRS